jgi:hypothetical protein
VWSWRGEGTKIKTTKISSEELTCNSVKFCTSENFSLYGMREKEYVIFGTVLGVANWIHSLSSQTFRFCMRAGGHYSDFKLVWSTRNAKFELAIAEATPFNYSARGGGANAPYSYCIQYEIWKILRKIHAGGDNKLLIQFASPYRYYGIAMNWMYSGWPLQAGLSLTIVIPEYSCSVGIDIVTHLNTGNTLV